jgi:alkylation response protein AidB-like acyl-CoA dehydrogenase
MGFAGALVPEECGGVGLGLRDMLGVLEALAYELSPEPLAAVAVMSVRALTLAGGPAAERLLGEIASGERIVSLAWQEGIGLDAAAQPKTTAQARNGGYVLNGAKRYVTPAKADVFLVSAALDAGGQALIEVGHDADGLKIEIERGVDGRDLCHLTLNDVAVPAEAVMASGNQGATALEGALAAGAVAASAELLGVAKATLQKTLEYLRTRKQFNKAIGSFQALQHRSADLFIAQSLAEACLKDVSARFDAQDLAGQKFAASRVKARASASAVQIGRESIQLHGAIGYTEEYEIGAYLKRVLALSAWLGNAAEHRQRLADMVDRGELSMAETVDEL